MSHSSAAPARVLAPQHPSLAPEAHIDDDHRVLELRVYWGEVLLAMQHYDKPKSVTIGEAKGAVDFFISSAGLPIGRFPLVQYSDGDYWLAYHSAMAGSVEQPGAEALSLDRLTASGQAARHPTLPGCRRVALAAHHRAIVQWGGVTFAMRFVAPPQVVAGKLAERIDNGFAKSLIGSVGLHLALLGTLLLYPLDTLTLQPDIFADPGRFGRLATTVPEQSDKMRDILKRLHTRPPEPLAKHRATATNRRVFDADASHAAEPARRILRNQRVQSLFADLIASGEMVASPSAGIGNVIGFVKQGSPSVAGIAGARRGRPGGYAGDGVGTRTIDAITTIGGGELGAIGRAAKQPRAIAIGEDIKRGDPLPRELIRKVIDGNKEQVRYCYENALQTAPELQGRVVMHWMVGGDGRVLRARIESSTLANKQVEQCLRQRIQSWRFPAPAGGGSVEVRYPFIFTAR